MGLLVILVNRLATTLVSLLELLGFPMSARLLTVGASANEHFVSLLVQAAMDENLASPLLQNSPSCAIYRLSKPKIPKNNIHIQNNRNRIEMARPQPKIHK